MSEPSKLGSRIKKWREAQGVTRAEVARAAGLSEAFVTALEEDNLCPSIGPLQKVAHALKVRLGTFMDDQVTRDPVISRENEREIDITMQLARDKRAAFRYCSLAKGKSDRAMEPFFIEISPEPPEDRTLSAHQGEEFILVVRGRLQVVYGKETFVLEPGDTIYYNSAVPHYVGAEGATAASIYAVLYYPD